MGSLQDSNQDAAREGDSANGPGQRLRAAREARQLTRDAVAVQLRVEPRIIEALERDDYAQLPAAVFIRGYLRAYARLVSIAPEPLIEAFDSRTPQTPPPLVLPAAIGPDMESRSGYGLWIVLALALLSAVLFYQWWRLEGGKPPTPEIPANSAVLEPETPQASTDPATVIPSPAPGVPLESLYGAPPDESETASTDTPVPLVAPDQTAAVPDQAAALVPAAPAFPPPVAAAAPIPGDEPTVTAAVTAAPETMSTPEIAEVVPEQPDAPLVLRFNDDCWVVVRDASGRVLLQAMLKAGDRRALDGKPPLQVTLGNSPAVEIEYLGQRFDQSRYNGPSRVARFTLGQ